MNTIPGNVIDSLLAGAIGLISYFVSRRNSELDRIVALSNEQQVAIARLTEISQQQEKQLERLINQLDKIIEYKL